MALGDISKGKQNSTGVNIWESANGRKFGQTASKYRPGELNRAFFKGFKLTLERKIDIF
jgi:hypothetical protein